MFCCKCQSHLLLVSTQPTCTLVLRFGLLRPRGQNLFFKQGKYFFFQRQCQGPTSVLMSFLKITVQAKQQNCCFPHILSKSTCMEILCGFQVALAGLITVNQQLPLYLSTTHVKCPASSIKYLYLFCAKYMLS